MGEVQAKYDLLLKNSSKSICCKAKVDNPNIKYSSLIICIGENNVVKGLDEFLIGKEYWDFLGGENTFEQLLTLFDAVGKKFKEKIRSKIQEVARNKMSG